jgi:3-phenylpropionate/trans-cinnamate dioxygenase ferredoxin reductase subunit
VGGGFIGVEVAAALAARGVEVTLLERGAALWGGSFGTAVSEWAAAVLRSAGVTVRLGEPVVAVAAGAVRLRGESLPSDLVVAGVGVEPRVELGRAGGIRIDDGVVVDDAQRTSATNLFAAGDVARAAGRPRGEHWHAAREDGERAALALLAEPLPPRRAPWIFSEFAGHKLDAFGETMGCDEMPVAAGVHAFTRGGRVAGLVILDGAITPDAARSFVELGPSVDQLGPGLLQGAAGPRPVADG